MPATPAPRIHRYEFWVEYPTLCRITSQTYTMEEARKKWGDKCWPILTQDSGYGDLAARIAAAGRKK